MHRIFGQQAKSLYPKALFWQIVFSFIGFN